MDARPIRAALIAALAAALMGANYRTANFVVQTSDARLAEQFAKTAEQLRHDLAIAWLGEVMPDWYQPCNMTVQVGQIGAGGQTSFFFDRGEVYGWRMNIQGTAERVLDSVLPHEITHMIFASHFRAPLPRWADEGGATSVEAPSEQTKHRAMLVQFLRTGRGIAFSDMFVMSEYPPDMLPLYAQGHSLVEYLIQQGGRRKYISFLDDGMRGQNWVAALEKWYGVKDLGTLQNSWVAWVGQGFPPLQTPAPEAAGATQLASAQPRQPRPEPNLVYQVGAVAADPSATAAAAATQPAGEVAPAAAEPVRAQVARPQPIQRPRTAGWGR